VHYEPPSPIGGTRDRTTSPPRGTHFLQYENDTLRTKERLPQSAPLALSTFPLSTPDAPSLSYPPLPPSPSPTSPPLTPSPYYPVPRLLVPPPPPPCPIHHVPPSLRPPLHLPPFFTWALHGGTLCSFPPFLLAKLAHLCRRYHERCITQFMSATTKLRFPLNSRRRRTGVPGATPPPRRSRHTPHSPLTETFFPHSPTPAPILPPPPDCPPRPHRSDPHPNHLPPPPPHPYPTPTYPHTTTPSPPPPSPSSSPRTDSRPFFFVVVV